jgi:hypothetical protein
MEVGGQLQGAWLIELVGLSPNDHSFVGLVVAGDAAPRLALLLEELAAEELRGVVGGFAHSALGGRHVGDAVVDLVVVCAARSRRPFLMSPQPHGHLLRTEQTQ